MSKSKVYEIVATINLRYEFEVDATSRTNAFAVAENQLKEQIPHIKKEYDTYDIDIEQIEESEGHQ